MLNLATVLLLGLEIARVAPAGQTFDVVLETEKKPELNKMTVVTVKLVPKDPAVVPPTPTDLTFDARMPEHNHGMVVKPKVTTVAPGEFKIEGVKLHMAGKWELSVKMTAGTAPVAVSIPYQL